MMLLAAAAVGAVLLWPDRWTAASCPRAHTARSRGRPNPPSPARTDRLAGLRRRLPVLRRTAPTPGTDLDGLADLAEVLVPPLRAGASTAAAVRIAARALGSERGLAGLAADLSQAANAGTSLAEVWARAADGSRSADLAFLSRAWQLSERTGVPLATALATVASNLRARQAAERALAAATAGARASMAVLALLPATGPAIGLLFGLTPVDLYGRSTMAALSLAVGVALGVAGLLWSRGILRRALRPGTVS